ncbi:hypothetical protein DPMN_121124 [Dreissena polymorpha]|uniref:Uncharacterized protein n=1 Tax=Dreissena polymorpha TaxID=45954 RepID=A0A9D4GL48_DREPO|nr:hypothetical protein DPMN_121124 [Dreissena polymorpha]
MDRRATSKSQDLQLNAHWFPRDTMVGEAQSGNLQVHAVLRYTLNVHRDATGLVGLLVTLRKVKYSHLRPRINMKMKSVNEKDLQP